MQKLRMNPYCLACLVSKQLKAPEGADERTRLEYIRSMLRLAADAPDELTAPELNSMLDKLRADTFGVSEDYTERKSRFNQLMLSLEPELCRRGHGRARPAAARGRLRDCRQLYRLSRAGQRHRLALRRLLFGDVNVDATAYQYLLSELRRAKRLVYVTDNCGEIVADKLLLSEIRALLPKLDITIIVRGGDAAGQRHPPRRARGRA